MIEKIEINNMLTLDEFANFPHLTSSVLELQAEAATIVHKLRGKTVWMVNSTARGGGVAEMLPMLIHMIRELGVNINWLVLNSDNTKFFQVTKRIHNMIHGSGFPGFTHEERKIYESVNKENVDELMQFVKEGDVVVVHDPQPMALGKFLRDKIDVKTIWRCHIGLDVSNENTRSAWEFLKPYADSYDLGVFTAPEYIPPYMTGKAKIITPAIDPLSDKNKDLSPHKLIGILCNSGIIPERHPVVTNGFENRVMRLQADGRYAPATIPDEIGILYRPTIFQVSRWDHLKGFKPLLDAFVHLKCSVRNNMKNISNAHRRRMELARLVLAGPDPSSIQDDPEGQEVLLELSAAFRSIKPDIQRDIVLLTLPMQSRKENALMVNALHRCSSIVVQNSLQEGFGLTCTEAMWKAIPVLVSNACGLRQQVRDKIDGRMVYSANDKKEIANLINYMLSEPSKREQWGLSAKKRVLHEFLIFTQIKRWLRNLSEPVYQPISQIYISAIPA
jgi:trehalose synthase